MKYRAIILFLLTISLVNGQKIDHARLYGSWKIKGVLIRNEVISFWKADTLIKKLIAKRKIEQPGVVIPKGDSIAIVLGAQFLCEVLNNLELDITPSNEMIFQFAEGKEGSQDLRNHTLQFTFKDDSTMAAVDEKGSKSELKIIKLTPIELIISGISSARYMQLCFRNARYVEYDPKRMTTK